jgi:SOS-response transcriptional repressor LexA
MKLLIVFISCFFSLHSVAQDSVQRIKSAYYRQADAVIKRTITKPKLTTSQKIEAEINQFLDSMVRTADAGPFFIKKVKAGVNSILYRNYRNGLLTGTKIEEAYFVKCNAQTMTQKDIADGRLVLIAGYALLKPAEFEIRRFERILINKTPLQYASEF